jgi:hypothetical protein
MYMGLIAIRQIEPPPDAYMTIERDSELVGDFPITDQYLVKEPGDYQVALTTAILGRYEGSSEPFAVECGRGTLHLTGSDPNLGKIEEPLHAYTDGCSANQIDIINRTDATAQRAASIAKQLTFNGSPFYSRWFGAWKSSNATRVQYLVARYNDLDFEVRCGGVDCCDEGYYGCVRHYELFDRMYMCSPFYGYADSIDRDVSKVGALVHEHTHLSGLMKTNDIVDVGSCGGVCYGYQNALNLAQDPTCTASDPVSCKAVNNAANYEFFVVNALNANIAAAAL